MNFSLPTLLKSQSRRTTFLSEGVKLCGIVCAICAAPLAFVQGWIAVWLLIVLSVVGLGTFGIWAFNAVINRPLLDSEEHTEQMAAISLLGQNRENQPALIEAVMGQPMIENPRLSDGGQE